MEKKTFNFVRGEFLPFSAVNKSRQRLDGRKHLQEIIVMLRALVGIASLTLIILLPWQAQAYEVAAVADGGGVSGKVLFQGTPPPPAKLLITKDHEPCGKGQIERQEVDVKDGVLRGVVVYLDNVEKGKAFPKEAASPIVDQKKCQFVPYLQVVQDGAKITILNSDPVLHNIHAYELIGSAHRSMFNIAQPKVKPKVAQTVRVQRGNVVRIECDAHNWMLGWLFVAKNPYYAVVGEDGSFRIDEIPPGTYTLTAVHPVLGAEKTNVEVKAKGSASVSFTFSGK